jgi:hypothetical protein
MFLVSILNLSWLYRTLKENIFNVLSETTKPIETALFFNNDLIVLYNQVMYRKFMMDVNSNLIKHRAQWELCLS